MTAAGLLMLAYAYWKNPTKLRLSRQSIVRVILLGIFNIYLTNVLEVWGLKYLTSFKACFLYSLSPFLSALMSYLMMKEILSLRKWCGLLIGFAGFWPMLIHQSPQEGLGGHLGVLSFAEIAYFAAVLASVIGWILLKQLVHHDQCPPIVANGYSMLFGGILALLQSLLQESWEPIPVTNYTIWLESSLFLIIVSNIICYNLYGLLLKRFSPTFMAFAGLSTTIFAAFFGWFFHGEIITPWLFASLFTVFIGLVIFYFEEVKAPGEQVVLPSEEALGAPPEILLPRSQEVPATTVELT
jgi:drug/metabolite transporter (DMT)-like permease